MKDKIIKKNLPVIIVSTLVLVLGIVGLTLALTNGFSSNVVIDTANLGVEYSGNLTLPSTNLFPIEDSEIDTNTENVLTVTFTVKGVQSNPTDIPIIYDVILSDLDVPEELKSEYLKWQLKKNGSVISTGSFSKDFDTIKDGRLTLTEIQQDLPSYNSTADSYEFKLWISESCPGSDMSQCGPEQDQSNMLNKTLSGKIETVLYTKSKQALVRKPTRDSEGMLEYLGLTVNEGTPDFSQVATTDEGIYAAQDDYGTSYYFRGAVTNNYVKFAEYYWRIIRINGDGTIRLIYDGTRAHANGESSSDRQIGTSRFNSTRGDNAYVGYMMGIDNECESTTSCSGSTRTTSYSQATNNTYSSTIKTTVDNWYKTNIVDAGYSDKVADVIYCNDRSMKSGTGYGTTVTFYGGYQRIVDGNNPVLTCSQKNDAFTVSDTTKGNGALTYPVGLITADEMSMGGGVDGSSNRSYYLYTGQNYWTMSPYYFNSGYAYEFFVDSYGNIYNRLVSNSRVVRPVLSLKSDITVTGTGTQNDPFLVQ